MLDCKFRIYARKGPVTIVNWLKSVYNSPFKDSHSRSIHTYFPITASNVEKRKTTNLCMIIVIVTSGYTASPIG